MSSEIWVWFFAIFADGEVRVQVWRQNYVFSEPLPAENMLAKLGAKVDRYSLAAAEPGFAIS